MRSATRTVRPGLLMVALATLATGCGREDKSPPQVLARVEGDEITARQLEAAVATLPDGTRVSRRQTLDRLIDQQLLMRLAHQDKLDRDPRVLAALEEAQRRILAQAAADRLLAKPQATDPHAEQAYFDQHPELFAERKLYRLHAFLLPANAMNAALRRQLDAARTPQQTRALLVRHRLAFEDGELQRAAEQIPPAMLAKLATLRPGDILVLDEAPDHPLYQLVEAVAAPLRFSTAQPSIRHYLQQTQRERYLAAQLAQLRASAKIEYLATLDTASAAPSPSPLPAGASADPTRRAGLLPPAHAAWSAFDANALPNGVGGTK